MKSHLHCFSLQIAGIFRYTIYNKHCAVMEFQMIAQIAFEGMKTLVTTLRERAERFRELFFPPQPHYWLTTE